MTVTEKSKHRVTGMYRESKRLAAAPQIAALKVFGCARIESYDEFPEWSKRIRQGDMIAVTQEIVLGPSRDAVRATLRTISDMRAAVYVLTSKRHSAELGDAADIALAAISQIAGDGRAMSPEEAAKRGKNAWQKKREERTKPSIARACWRNRDNDHLTSPEVCLLPEMRGWTASTAAKKLGPRGLAKGRPRKVK